MPKRSAEEKINYYNAKIKKLQEKQAGKKYRHREFMYDSDTNYENGTQFNDTPLPWDPRPCSPTPAVPPQISAPCSPLLAQQTSEEVVPPVLDKEIEPEIDSDLLDALGDASEESPTYGPNIHSKLAQRWLPILKKGLLPEPKEKLLKEYSIPDNCRLLKAPTVNPELSAAITDITKNRDKKIQAEQNQLGLGITAINKALTMLLTEEDKVQAIRILSDGCRILTDLHYIQTQVRSKLITRGLDKSFLAVIQDQDRDETLFGLDLPEKIKASKAIERQGLQIKKAPVPKPSTSSASQPAATRSRYQGNWSGPSRLPSSSRGGRTTQYRNQYRRAQQTAMPAVAQYPVRQATSNNIRRAPTRQ